MRTLGYTQEVLRSLIAYTWPGNVRDLAHACSLFVIYAKPGAWIDPALIDASLPDLRRADPSPKAGPLLGENLSMHDAVRAFQRELILSRLELYKGSVKAARESLGLTKATFHRYMKSLEISVRDGTKGD